MRGRIPVLLFMALVVSYPILAGTARKVVRPAVDRGKITMEGSPPAARAPGRDRKAPERAKDGAEQPPELLLVNKGRRLAADYVPPGLRQAMVPFAGDDRGKRLLRQEAAQALEGLFRAAAGEGLELLGVSAYRSYQRQQEIFTANAKRRGEEAANQFSARPGESEHQSGLAIDVSTPDLGGSLTQAFGDTKTGRWLAANASEYGFILRYPAGKEELTGYQYEPWHLRYVGQQAAQAMAERGLILEEYV